MKALQSGYAHYKEWQALSDVSVTSASPTATRLTTSQFLGAAVRLKTLTSDLIGSNDVAILKQVRLSVAVEKF